MADQTVQKNSIRQMSPGQGDELGKRDLASHRAEKVNRVLYAIANAVNSTPDLDKLYQVIHQALSSIIDVTNSFIAIVNSEKKTLFFPYYVDTVDKDFSPITDFDTGNSLTGLVVLRREPLLLRSQQLQERAQQEGIWGPTPLIWMGVPLMIRNEVIGVIAVQSYTNPDMYTEDDLQLLSAVSNQIALAIDRKQSLDDLRESERRFRQLFEQSNDAILIYDGEGTILDCNVRATELLGYPRQQLLALNVFDLHFREDLAAIQQIFRDVEKKGDARYETAFRTMVGVRVEVEISARLIEQKIGGTIQAIIRDVTSRKSAERRLLENEQKYRNLFYNAQVGLFRSSPEDDAILESNDALARMAGYENRQDFLANFSVGGAYLNPLDRQHFLSVLKNRGGITNFEAPLRRKNGEVGWFRFTASYYPEHNWIEGVVVDITEMKQATEEKFLLQKKLEQSRKMEALGMLAGGVAHDLNNILAGIISYPELMLLRYGDQPELKKPLEAILEAGNRAAMIVADMLVIARSSASVMEHRDVHELIEEYLLSPEFVKIEASYPDISIRTELTAPHSIISCSTVHVKKCLMNLVTNGFEAIEGSGTVTISTRTGRMHPDSPENDAIVVTVQDTGSGIRQEDVEHIFEPFYTKKMMGRSGTGLGLTVVWNTVQNHGGRVQVDSSLPGTSFIITLPVVTVGGGAIDKSAKTSRVLRGNGETILVVDDEPQLREIACQLLGALGYLAYAVESGESALTWLKEQRADLVLLDMLMEPGMNGAETYEKIIALHPGQKAVIASGFSESEDVKAGMRLGVGGFIRKPYTMEQLSQVVHKVLSAC
ncbi:PAS domain S-box protein [Desulfopila aestuarii]|nr:PAS domain S-box protein [Desulfopila aestuarii]